MAWQNPQHSELTTKGPITTQVGPGMAIPMHQIPGSLEGGLPYPPPGIPGAQSGPYPPIGMPGVQPGPYPPIGMPGVQPGPYPPIGMPGVQPGPYPPIGMPGAAPNAPLLEGGWPTPNTNYPVGLECLMTLDTLFVQQQVEMLEAITGWETENKYLIKNARGQVVFQVEEDSNCCARSCCGSYRPFDMKITDSSMCEVIRVSRSLRCDSCCCPCFLQEMEVFASNVKIGTIVQNWNAIRPSFSICDLDEKTVLMIKGPVCLCPFGDVNFKVLSSDGEHKVGRISKKWSGFVQECFTDSDVFGINFPLDLDIKVKALLLAACLLIDFMYFESSAKKA